MSLGGAMRWVGVVAVAAAAFVAGMTRQAWWPGRAGPGGADLGAGAAGFTRPYIELGRQPWHSSVEFTAEFVNNMEQAVKVAAVRPACDCTVVDVNEYVGRDIRSGERLLLKGRLDTGSKVGRRASEIVFLLDTGALYAGDVRFDVFATYDFSPARVVFERVNLDEEDADAVSSVLFISESAAITAPPTVDVPWLQVATEQRSDGGTVLHLHVVKENLPFGESHAQLRIETDDRLVPFWVLPVTATGTARVRAIPERVFLRAGETKRVRLVGENGVAVAVARLAADAAALKVSRSEAIGEIVITLAGAAEAAWIPVEVIDERGFKARIKVHVAPEPREALR